MPEQVNLYTDIDNAGKTTGKIYAAPVAPTTDITKLKEVNTGESYTPQPTHILHGGGSGNTKPAKTADYAPPPVQQPTTAELLNAKTIAERFNQMNLSNKPEYQQNVNPIPTDISRTKVTDVSPIVDIGYVDKNGRYNPINPDIKGSKYVPAVTVTDEYSEETVTDEAGNKVTTTIAYPTKTYSIPTRTQTINLNKSDMAANPSYEEPLLIKKAHGLFSNVPNLVFAGTSKLVSSEKPHEVYSPERKYLSSGTGLFDTTTKEYNAFSVPISEINKAGEIKYFESLPKVAATVASFGQYAIPIYGEMVLASGAIAAPYDLGTGLKTRNLGQYLQGVGELLPILILGSSKVAPLISAKLNPEIVTTTELYSRGESLVQTNADGRFGVVNPTDKKASGLIITNQPNPDLLIERTTKLREWFGLEPSSTTLVRGMGTSDLTLQAKLKNYDIGATQGFVYDLNTKPFNFNQQYVSETLGKSVEMTPDELFSYPANTKMALNLEEQFGLNLNSKNIRFFSFKQQTGGSFGQLPTGKDTIGIMVVEEVPTGISGETKILDVKTISQTAGEVGNQYGSYFFKYPEIKSDFGNIVVNIGEKTTSPIYQKQVAEFVANIPVSKPTQIPFAPITKATTDTGLLAPAIVGGAGQDLSWWYGQGGIQSNTNENTGILTVGGTEFKIRDNTVTKITNIEKPMTGNIEIPRLNTGSGTRFDLGSRQDERQNQQPVQQPIQVEQPVQDIFQAPRQNQQQRQMQQTIQETSRRFRGFRTSLTVKPPVPVPLLKSRKSPLFSKIEQAYKVVVFRGGKEQQIASGLPRGRALQVGVKNVLSTLRASFKLKPSGTTSMEDIPYRVPAGFRFSKYDKNRYVQLKNLRFGSRPETKEAQFFRKVKKGKIKWF